MLFFLQKHPWQGLIECNRHITNCWCFINIRWDLPFNLPLLHICWSTKIFNSPDLLINKCPCTKFIYQQITISSWHNNTGPMLSHWLIIHLAVKISSNFWKLILVCVVLFIQYHTIKMTMLLKSYFKISKGLTLQMLP